MFGGDVVGVGTEQGSEGGMNTRLPKERESKVQRSIIVRLRRLGIVLFRRNVMLARTPDGRKFRVEAAGRSDLYGWHMKTARHFEIEVKAANEKPTPKQLAWLKECHANGAVAYWSDSVNDAEKIAEAVLGGGKIIWHDDEDFHIEMP
jgi:hypothetical protein